MHEGLWKEWWEVCIYPMCKLLYKVVQVICCWLPSVWMCPHPLIMGKPRTSVTTQCGFTSISLPATYPLVFKHSQSDCRLATSLIYAIYYHQPSCALAHHVAQSTLCMLGGIVIFNMFQAQFGMPSSFTMHLRIFGAPSRIPFANVFENKSWFIQKQKWSLKWHLLCSQSTFWYTILRCAVCTATMACMWKILSPSVDTMTV